MRQLLVFDIDGTLLLSGPVVHESFARSFEHAAGVPARLEGLRFAGRTDRGIFADLHRRGGSKVPLAESFEAFRAHCGAACVAVGTFFGRGELAGADIFVQDLSELVELAPWG